MRVAGATMSSTSPTNGSTVSTGFGVTNTHEVHGAFDPVHTDYTRLWTLELIVHIPDGICSGVRAQAGNEPPASLASPPLQH